MSGNFKLIDLLNNRSKQWEEESSEEGQQEGDLQIIDIDSLVPSKENFYGLDKKESMKASIRIVGIEQPLRVEPIEGQTGKYKVLAGHCRLSASKELAEEDEKYRYVPCYVKDRQSKQLSCLTMLLTNFTQREPTDYEKMLELTEIEKIAKEIKQQENISGRVRDMIAELLSISASQIGRYTAIRNNLDCHLMEAFQQQEIAMSIAYEASGLNPANQIKLYVRLKEKGKIEVSDVKEFKRLEEEEKKEEASKPDINHSHFEGAMNEPEQMDGTEPEPESEPEGPQPEGKEVEEEPVEIEDKEEKKETDQGNKEHKTGGTKNQSQPEPERQSGSRIEKGCGFCAPQNHREISTMEGGILINLDPMSKQLQILIKETGAVESVTIVACPLCGRIL